MHPHYHVYHRGPGRLFWFIIGGLAATWWHKSRQSYQRELGCTWRHRRELEAGRNARFPDTPFAGTSAGPVLPANGMSQSAAAAPVPTANTPSEDESWEDLKRQRWSEEQRRRVMEAENDKWEAERERIRQFAQEAEDKMSEYSEATLDKVAAAVDAMKARLSERRTQQQEMKRREDQIAEDQRRSPTRWV